MTTHRPFGRTLIVKLAASCNLACDYCYWFRDVEVNHRPAVMRPDVAARLPGAIRDHVLATGLAAITVVFHGGEPLLYRKDRFDHLCRELRTALADTECRLDLAVTTNAVLVDAGWSELFRRHAVSVSVSLDGERARHDQRRVSRSGAGSYDQALAGIRRLQGDGVDVNVLSVADLDASPRAVLAQIVDEVGVGGLDVLFPDAVHDDPHRPVGDFFIGLFDAWFDDYLERGVRLRIFEVLIERLVGGDRATDVLGPKTVDTLTIHSDGELDVTDVVNAIPGWELRPGSHPTLARGLASLESTDRYQRLRAAAESLPAACRRCPVVRICGGGHLVSRWSAKDGFDNVSVYCRDIQRLAEHAWRRLAPTLSIETASARTPLVDA